MIDETTPATPIDECDNAPERGSDEYAFWHSYIDEKAEADFLGMKPRFIQKKRHEGGGPRYYEISARCVRYTRHDGKLYMDEKARLSVATAANPNGADDATSPHLNVERVNDAETT